MKNDAGVAGIAREVVRRVAAGRAGSPGLPLDVLLPILCPGTTEFESLLAEVQGLLGGRDSAASLADLRLILSWFDRQAYPSPVRVGLPEGRIRWHHEDGLRFALDPDDRSVSVFAAETNFEPHVTAVLEKVCRPGWHVVDVGANVGYHTVRLASLVGEAGAVVAIEANPDNCALICAAVEANRFTNVRLLPVGLGREWGWSQFSSHIGTNGGLLGPASSPVLRQNGTIVPLVPLDDVVGPDRRVDLIKIDVEGAEGQVIDGAKKTLARDRPVVVSELSCEMLRRISAMEPAAYLGRFAALGYHVHVIDKETPGRLIGFESPEALLAAWPGDQHIADLLLTPAAQ